MREEIDLSKIKPGDRVRIRYMGLEGWHVVKGVSDDGLFFATVEGLYSRYSEIEVLEHEPAPVTVELVLPAAVYRREFACAVDGPATTIAVVDFGEDERPAHIIPGQDGSVVLSRAAAEAFGLALIALARKDRS